MKLVMLVGFDASNEKGKTQILWAIDTIHIFMNVTFFAFRFF